MKKAIFCFRTFFNRDALRVTRRMQFWQNLLKQILLETRKVLLSFQDDLFFKTFCLSKISSAQVECRFDNPAENFSLKYLKFQLCSGVLWIVQSAIEIENEQFFGQFDKNCHFLVDYFNI